MDEKWIGGFKPPLTRKRLPSCFWLIVMVVPVNSESLWTHRSTERVSRQARLLLFDHPWILTVQTFTHWALNMLYDVKYYFNLKLLLHQMVCQSCFIMHDSTWHRVALWGEAFQNEHVFCLLKQILYALMDSLPRWKVTWSVFAGVSTFCCSACNLHDFIYSPQSSSQLTVKTWKINEKQSWQK